jgi:hypothetical protein
MCFLPILSLFLRSMEREKSSRTAHVPVYPSWYIVFPTLLLTAGTGLIAIGIYGFVASRWEVCEHTFALVTMHSPKSSSLLLSNGHC